LWLLGSKGEAEKSENCCQKHDALAYRSHGFDSWLELSI
jgi:hypothetical protein